ncbi:MAG: monofunctional biosynthetic peptidoglycan transglycosylase [Saprospiraceae bacterium]|nr:monofunctional biosynthetic peptidoglycan transglycosylase [Saprospiraceae bacterium]
MQFSIALLKSKFKALSWPKKILAILGFIISLHWLYFFYLIFFFPPVTLTQLNGLIHADQFHRDYVCIDDVSKYGKLAFIAAEDQLFLDHFGFDMESIEKAWEYNAKKKGKKKRGASTISQQVAKNVFLWQGRSWIRKGLEVYFTFMIELLWSKKRILEMYINVIEMGDGIYGIEAASKQYFKKSAKTLNAEEAAKIAACLPNPKKYKVKPLSTWVSFRTPWVMSQMEELMNDEDIQKLIRD